MKLDYIILAATDPRLPNWSFDLRWMVHDCDGYGKKVEVPEQYWDELLQLAVLDGRIYAEESQN